MRPRNWTWRRPSPALAVSMIALLVALSGSALALSRGEVKSKHIAKNAVKSKHVKDGKLKARDLAAEARFPKVVLRQSQTSGSGEVTKSTFCDAGEVAVGGGHEADVQGSVTRSQPVSSRPDGVPNGWHVRVLGPQHTLKVWVSCAQP